MYEPDSTSHGLPPTRGPAEEGWDRRPGRPVDPHRLLRILRRARAFVLLALIGGGAAGFAVAHWLMPRQYESIASVVYEGVPDVEGIPSAGEAELPTMLDSVKLPENLRAVREHIGSDEPLHRLADRVTVTVEHESNVMNVAARAGGPAQAAVLTDTVVEVFLAQREKVERRRLEEHLAGLEADLDQASKALAQARGRYDEFREENGIADLTTEQERAIEAAAALRAQADVARAEAQAEDARLRELRQAMRGQTRTVVTEVQTSADAAELARLQAELTQASASMSADHPRVASLRQRVAALSQRVTAGEARPITDRTIASSPGFEALQGSVHGSAANRTAARQREEALEELASAARERLRQLTELEGRASTLLASVRVAEAHVAALEVRRRALVDALRSPSSGFRVVSAAMTPEHPVPSQGRWAVAAGIPFTMLLLVLAWSSFRELGGFKVVTPREVGYWGNGPVLGATVWPDDPEGLPELVSELDDHFPEASGSTLVVGATEAEERHALQIADCLMSDWQPTTYVDLPPPARAGKSGGGTALAVQEPADGVIELLLLDVQPYMGPYSGPKLRRAARLADRVIVVVESGRHSAVEITKLRDRLGRLDMRLGFVVVGLPKELSELPDRVGDVDAFWTTAPRKRMSEPSGEAA